MASTRNKNTRNNYAIELNKSIHTQDYLLAGDYAQSNATACPGNGLGGAYIPRSKMSNNPIEIESFLFGIGSSDLTKDVATLDPELKCLPTYDIFSKQPTVVPNKFIPNNTQRPQFK